MKKEALEGRHYLAALPAVFLLILWPCLVHMETVRTNLENQVWFPDLEYQSDFFMHIRSGSIRILAVIMLLVLVDKLLLRKEKIFSLRRMGPLAAYAGFVVLSTLLSVDRATSLGGMIEQYETVWTLLSYLVIFWYFLEMAHDFFTIQDAVGCILIGAFIQCLIGFSQMLHHDFWSSRLGMTLLTWGNGNPGNLDFVFNTGEDVKIYMSFYNPNYCGLYLVMMIPIAVFGIGLFRQLWQKIGCGLLAAGLCICLIGSGSKTGLVVVTLLLFAGIVLYFEERRKRLVFLGGVLAVFAAYLVIGWVLPGQSVPEKIYKNAVYHKDAYALKKLTPAKGKLNIKFRGKKYKIVLKDVNGEPQLRVWDQNGKGCKLIETADGFWKVKKMKSNKLKLDAEIVNGQYWITVSWRGSLMDFMAPGKGQKYQFINPAGKPDVIRKADSVSFLKGYERAMTGRIYLWSRTIPLLKKYLLWGSGPDTFALVFPQNDYLMRASTYRVLYEQIITKAHNMYLQSGIETGLLSVVCLLIFFVRFLRRGLIGLLHAQKEKGKAVKCWRMAMFLSILGFMLMGLTNDSVVVTSPLFWAIFGLGSSLKIEDMQYEKKA